ncbi:PssD/Cps14F family polysaccharide biosynthesis glycosyltransferase [Maribacter luteus]|uniref:PssD/Cps14F family polysaccharide biosynthesis glycosyltransferase n=1 Tax=Maribacter luteus TaxID=2594478 RepID=UPI0024928A88|nr:PssD/Cps14F family polysaccharide biosynthesis glycosyltransferase [Maribacter luteus]
MQKLILISSVGGHLEQLLGLNKIIEKYDTYIVTETNSTTIKMRANSTKIFLLPYISRNYLYSFIVNYFKLLIGTVKIYNKVRPDIIVTTGTGCTIPMCFLGKLMGSKVIFIETFARVRSKTLTGKICYYIADVFIVQWKELKNIYPKAVYLGHIY